MTSYSACLSSEHAGGAGGHQSACGQREGPGRHPDDQQGARLPRCGGAQTGRTQLQLRQGLPAHQNCQGTKAQAVCKLTILIIFISEKLDVSWRAHKSQNTSMESSLFNQYICPLSFGIQMMTSLESGGVEVNQQTPQQVQESHCSTFCRVN